MRRRRRRRRWPSCKMSHHSFPLNGRNCSGGECHGAAAATARSEMDTALIDIEAARDHSSPRRVPVRVRCRLLGQNQDSASLLKPFEPVQNVPPDPRAVSVLDVSKRSRQCNRVSLGDGGGDDDDRKSGQNACQIGYCPPLPRLGPSLTHSPPLPSPPLRECIQKS